MALTIAERVEKARRIIVAMQARYDEQGEEGDFADGERYLRDDAPDAELLSEEIRWCGMQQGEAL